MTWTEDQGHSNRYPNVRVWLCLASSLDWKKLAVCRKGRRARVGVGSKILFSLISEKTSDNFTQQKEQMSRFTHKKVFQDRYFQLILHLKVKGQCCKTWCSSVRTLARRAYHLCLYSSQLQHSLNSPLPLRRTPLPPPPLRSLRLGHLHHLPPSLRQSLTPKQAKQSQH